MKKFIFFFLEINYLILILFEKIFQKKIFIHICDFFYQKISIYKKSILGKEIKFFVPNSFINWRLNTYFTKEPDTIDFINKFKSSKKIVFFDIGSNIGLYSIYASLRHKNILVVSFEPSASNLVVLKKNIGLNNLEKKILIYPVALSNSLKHFNNFYESTYQFGYADHHLEKKKKNSQNCCKIYTQSINFIIKQKILEIPDYIKIDVDGNDFKILKSFQNFLNNKKIKGLLIEKNKNSNKIISYLRNFKFQLIYEGRNLIFEKKY